MPATDDQLNQIQKEYLVSQTLGRLATVDAHGAPQNNPVVFRVNEDGTIDIGGYDMAKSRKFRNIAANDQVALVVDDLIKNPWSVRFVEIRGVAEQVLDGTPPGPGQSSELIRVHPKRIISYGLSEEPGTE